MPNNQQKISGKEKTLNEIPVQYKQLVAHSTDAILLSDAQGNIAAVSDEAVKLFGYSNKEELVGEPVAQLITPKQRRMGKVDFTKLLISGLGKNYFYTLLRKDDSEFEGEISAALIREENGTPLGFLAIIRDITNRQQEEKIKQSLIKISEIGQQVNNIRSFCESIHKDLSTLLQADNFFVALRDDKRDMLEYPYFVDIMDDPEGKKTIASRKWGKGITEYTIQKGETVLLITHDIKELQKAGKIELIGSLPYEWLGVPLKTKENKTIGLLAVQSYYKDIHYTESDKEILTFVSTQIAITLDRLQSQEELRERESKFRAIFERSALGIILNDKEGKFLDCNRRFEEIIGYSNEELKTKTFLDLTHHEDVERCRKTYFDLVNTPSKGYYQIEKRYVHKDGSPKWIKATVSSVTTSKNEVLYCISSIDDITELKKIEEKEEKQNNLLQGAVEASHHLLTETDFAKSIQSSLESLGKAANVERAYIFENIYDSKNDQLCISQRYEWTKREELAQIDNPKLQNLPYSGSYERWYHQLSKGKTIKGNIKDFPGKEKPLLEDQNITSVLVVPIFVGDLFWGFIGFDVCGYEYEWYIGEENILKAAAASIGGAIQRWKIWEVIEESERKFRLISENSQDLVCLHDAEGIYQYVSPSVRFILGYTGDELLGANPYDIIHEDDKKRVKTQSHEKVLNKGKAVTIEYRIRKKNGKYVWFETLSTPIKDESGEIVQIQSTSRDITKRKEAEMEIKKSEEKFRSIWEKSIDGMRLADENGIVKMVNSAYCNLVEKSEDELVGHKFSEIQAPEKQDEVYTTFLERIKTNIIPQHHESKIKLWNGKEKWFALTNNIIDNVNGNKIILNIFRDITDKKETEEKLKQYANQLEASNAAKDKFFSIISHDLKSPFSALLGYSEFLVEDYEDLDEKEKQEFIFNIYDVAKNVFSLLENLLQWSRIQTGRIEINPENFSICALIDKVYNLFKETAQSKKIDLKLGLDENCLVYGDENATYTVLRNLVSNALKFTAAEGTITISTRYKKENVEVSITDTGVGISEEDQKKIFKIDSHHTTIGTNKEKGTGLGLILSKELVEKNGGEIRIDSTIGKGTTFTFTLQKKDE